MDVSASTSWKDRLRQERIRRNWRQQDLADQLGTTVVTIQRWERGSHQPSAYFRIKLCALFGKSAEELGLVPEGPLATPPEIVMDRPVKTFSLPSLPTSSGLWSVPYSRNPFFTGREGLLHTLHEQLHQQHTLALTQSWAISGLGGIGKTQIALEYAYRYRQDYRTVLWTSAATRETLLSGLVTIADLLQLPQIEERDHNRVIGAVKQWLTSHQQWLLILDNADDLTVLHDVVPMELGGHLLLTTRAQALGALARRLEVETMGMVEATLFLLHRAKLLAPDMFLDQASDEQLATAEALAIEMDFLPLALDQAGAYIEEMGCSLSAYLKLYRTHRKALLQRRGSLPTSHPEPVATTWSLSFEKIEQTNLAAAELLRLCAFLEPDTIPEELISEGSAHLGPVLGPVAKDPLRFDEAVQVLRAFSLVQRHPESKLLGVHRLVQVVLKESMGAAELQQWAERAIRVTATVFPEIVEADTWPACRRYLPQAQACSILIEEPDCTFVEAASLLYRTARYLHDYALYDQAEPLYQRSLRIRERLLGSQHPLVAEALHGLADLSRERGNYAEAESLFMRAIQIREQALGGQHPLVATSLESLGKLYFLQARYEQAEVLYQRALSFWEQAWGFDHPQVASVLTNLGILYYQQGKYEQTEAFYQRALQISEQALGPQHPTVTAQLHNLGELYSLQGKDEQARALFERALQIREEVLGPQHPAVAPLLAQMGVLCWKQGKYEQAELFYQRALRIREQALGPQHPEVAYTLHCLGLLYCQQCNYTQAEPFYQRALSILEQALGPQHPDLTNPLNDLGALYYQQARYEQAEAMLQRTLHILEPTLGSEHPAVAYPLNNLGLLYYQQGKYDQAEAVLQRALQIREQALGAEHSLIASSLDRLGTLYCQQGQYEQARSFLERALSIREQALGSQHPQVAYPLYSLGLLCYQEGKYEQAEALFERALRIWEEKFGPEHPEVADPLHGLANLLREQGQYEQARARYLRALTLRQRHLGLQHPDVADSLHDLARCYEMQQQLTEARSLYQQALAIREQVLGASHQKTRETRDRLRIVLQAMGKTEEAAVLEEGRFSKYVDNRGI